MLFQYYSLLIFGVGAVFASTANEAPQVAISDFRIPTRVCPKCLPCRVDCLCSEDHVTNCLKTPPKDPSGIIVCGEDMPCNGKCACNSFRNNPNGHKPGKDEPVAIVPHPPKGSPAEIRVCGEYMPCDDGCACSFRSISSYLKLDDLSSKTAICPQGTCTEDCVCREALVESLQDLLFPPKSPAHTPAPGHEEL